MLRQVVDREGKTVSGKGGGDSYWTGRARKVVDREGETVDRKGETASGHGG